MQHRDKIRLQHMLDAAIEAQGFIEGLNLEDLQHDRKLQLALVQELTIIGEAANAVSDNLQETLGQIPWRIITGMRNRLVHVYFDIDLDLVWSTVQDDLSTLITTLEEIL